MLTEMDVKQDKYEAFAWGSSKVDWCESNFIITDAIAEFWNTISNILFFVFPPLLIYLFQRHYVREVTPAVHLVWGLMFLVGIGSVYFHATLSLVGQLVDENAIIWVIMAAVGLWWPAKFMPAFCKQNRLRFQMYAGMACVLGTVLSVLKPSVNCLVLFLLSVPAVFLLIVQTRSCSQRSVVRLCHRCFLMWIIALTSWISDRVFCDSWHWIGFPYMHGVWHIFVALGAYQACVLFAFFDAMDQIPYKKPVIRYWPKDDLDYKGVPYVTFEDLQPLTGVKTI